MAEVGLDLVRGTGLDGDVAGLLVVMLVGCLHGSKVDSFSRSLSS
jgi:hypothetical protein